MSDRQRQQKQRYLRQNILQKQYDAQQFMDFCQNYKGSVDIDSWTLYQLQDIVSRFIQKKSNQNDQFSSFQMGTQSLSPNKNNNDDWANFSNNVPQIQAKKQTNLSSVDLDFLQMMGMSVPQQPKKQQQKPPQNPIKPVSQIPKPQFTSISNNLQKPKPKNPNQQFVKQMQNENFISVFNNQPNMNKSSSTPANFDPFAQLQKTVQQKPVSQNAVQKMNPTISPQKKHSNQSASINITNENPKPPTFQPIIKPQRDYPQNGPQQQFSCQIKCRQILKNKLPSQNIICRVTNHQVINPNVFVPNFVLYTINTTPLNVQVKRRMKDFEQLRNMLKKLFPTTQIPFLQRYSRLSQTQPHIISKQKILIQSFLNSLLMNSTLKCRIVQDFLLCTDLDMMKKIFRQFQRIQKPKGIQDLWTTSGFVKLDTKTASRKYMNQQQLYIDFVQNSFNKLKVMYDQLITYYQNTSKIMDQIATVYDQLKQTTKIVNENFHQNLRFNTFQPMLGQVTYLHRQLSQSLQRQSKTIQTQLRHLFKYQISNITTVKQNMKTLSNLYQAYEKRGDKDAAKRQTYESKKMAQFKNNAEIPSKHITVLKYQAAYAQNQFKDELRRYMDELARKIGNQFQIFSTLQVSIAADMDIVWRQFHKFVQKR